MAQGTVSTAQEDADIAERGPLLRVERGAPGPDEIAALLALLAVFAGLAARGSGDTAGQAIGKGRRAWNDPAELLRHHRYPRPRR